IGMTDVAFCAAATAGDASAMMTLGFRAISWARRSGSTEKWPFASRKSMMRFLPSSYPKLAREMRIKPRILPPWPEVTSATRQVLEGGVGPRPPARRRKEERTARLSGRLIRSPRRQQRTVLVALVRPCPVPRGIEAEKTTGDKPATSEMG